MVGSGLKPKSDTRRPLASLIPNHLTLISENVKSFSPKSSSLITSSGRSIQYDALVVAAGLQINWDNITGLKQALIDSSSGVSSIYSYDTCDKVWSDIDSLRSGHAVFTQPAGIVKCAGGMFWYYPPYLYHNCFSTPENHVDGQVQVPAHVQAR